MKYSARFGIVFGLIGSFAFAQSSPEPPEQLGSLPADSSRRDPKQTNTGNAIGNVDVLTDTGGVDFNAYLQSVMKTVKQRWYFYIPESAQARLRMQAKVTIAFAIMKDGTVQGMKIEESSGDPSLDRAAWASIATANPLPSLPAEFSGPSLNLRFHFFYNPEGSNHSGIPTSQGMSLAGHLITVHITGPNYLRVTLGSSYLLTAVVRGTANQGLSWTVTGEGCSDSACGKVIDGL